MSDTRWILIIAATQDHFHEPRRQNLSRWCRASCFCCQGHLAIVVSTHRWLYERACSPLVALWVGWHQGVALPGCGCSGISHRGQYAGCNVACPPTRRGGCSATEECTSACPAAVGDVVAGATELSSSEDEGQYQGGCFGGEGLLDVKSLVFSRLTGTGGRNPIRNKIIPWSSSDIPSFNAGALQGGQSAPSSRHPPRNYH